MEDKPERPGGRPPRDTSPRAPIGIWDTSAVTVRREREGVEREKPGGEPSHPERRATPLAALTGPVPALLGGWIAAATLASFHSPITAVLVVLGLFGALIAGLVGVGGAIVMIPLLLFVPPLFGADQLSMHTVAGVTMIQVAAAGIAGMLAHHGRERVDATLVGVLGGAMMFGALGGAVLSRYVSAGGLEATFAALATAAAVLMLLRRQPQSEKADRWDGRFNRPLSVMLGGGVGVLAGMVGAGGGFLLMPLMIHVLHIPLRAAVGASLGVVALSGIAGALGKGVSGQVDWLLALALVAGALPGAQIGALISRRMRVQTLSLILGVFIALVAIRMWWGILQ